MTYLPILLILLGSLLLRAIAAWISVGYDHPNEICRLFEPMGVILGFTAHPPWEWKDGLLSELPVRTHLWATQIFQALGAHDALLQMQLLRLSYGVLSLAPILVTWRWVLRSGAPERMALIAAMILGFWPEWIYRSVRLMDYSLETSLSAIAVGLIFWTWKQGRKSWEPPPGGAALAGITLGLLFFVRYQSGLYLFAICGGLILLIGRRARATILIMTAVYGLTVLSGATIELHFFARPHAPHLLDPFFNYIQYNWVEGRAALDYGAQPWHRYFSETAKFFGFAPAIVFGLLMLRRRTQWPWAFMALFPLLALTLIQHKEGRFIYGALWLWIPAAFCSLKFYSTAERRVWGTLMIASLVCGCVINSQRIRGHFLLRAQEVREFAEIGRLLEIVQIERTAEAVHPTGALIGKPGVLPELRIQADPVFNPGAFFLRYKGSECFNAECKPMVEGQPYLSIYRDQTGVWVLERQDVEDI